MQQLPLATGGKRFISKSASFPGCDMCLKRNGMSLKQQDARMQVVRSYVDNSSLDPTLATIVLEEKPSNRKGSEYSLVPSEVSVSNLFIQMTLKNCCRIGSHVVYLQGWNPTFGNIGFHIAA